MKLFATSCAALLVGAYPLAVSAEPKRDPYATPTDPVDEPQPVDSNAARGQRSRWGISGLAGTLQGGVDGVAGGVSVRWGGQINHQFGIYGQALILGGSGSGETAAAARTTSFVLVLGTALLGEFVFDDTFYVAPGPELFSGIVTRSEGGASSGDAGRFFGAVGRMGLAYGSVGPERRKAFSFGIETHVVFSSNVVVTPLLALGYEAF